MNSLILKTAARWLLPLLLAFSVFVMFRGHNDPGGGFIGGLLAASGFILVSFGDGLKAAQRKLFVSPHVLIGLGLLIAMLSAFPSLFFGLPLMTGLWGIDLWVTKIGTPTIFDIGVYLTVIGVIMMIFFSISEDDEEEGSKH